MSWDNGKNRTPRPEPETALVILSVRGEDGAVRSVAGVFPTAEGRSFQPGDVLLSAKVVQP